MRSVRYEPAAQEAADNACEQWLRTDDQINLLEWVISRDPTKGLALSESGNIRTLTVQGARSISSPTVTIVYEIEPHVISVLSARFEEAQSVQANETRH